MTIKKYVIKPSAPTLYELAISKKLNDEKTKKPKDVPLFILMGHSNRGKKGKKN